MVVNIARFKIFRLTKKYLCVFLNDFKIYNRCRLQLDGATTLSFGPWIHSNFATDKENDPKKSRNKAYKAWALVAGSVYIGAVVHPPSNWILVRLHWVRCVHQSFDLTSTAAYSHCSIPQSLKYLDNPDESGHCTANYYRMPQGMYYWR